MNFEFNRTYSLDELPEALAEQRHVVAALKIKVASLKGNVNHFELEVEKQVQYAPKESGLTNDAKRQIAKAEILDVHQSYKEACIALEATEKELNGAVIELQFLEDTFKVLLHV